MATDGYPYTRIDSNGDKRQLRYQGDMQIRVLLTDEQMRHDSASASPGLAYASPISVAPGATTRFTGVSEKLIKDLDQHGVVLDSYNAGERTFYLGSWAILPGSKPQRAQYTARQLFRDWETENEVPPKPGSRSRNGNIA